MTTRYTYLLQVYNINKEFFFFFFGGQESKVYWVIVKNSQGGRGPERAAQQRNSDTGSSRIQTNIKWVKYSLLCDIFIQHSLKEMHLFFISFFVFSSMKWHFHSKSYWHTLVYIGLDVPPKGEMIWTSKNDFWENKCKLGL